MLDEARAENPAAIAPKRRTRHEANRRMDCPGSNSEFAKLQGCTARSRQAFTQTWTPREHHRAEREGHRGVHES